MEILDSCVKISELLLLNINRKTVYEDSKFETSQVIKFLEHMNNL